MQIADSTFIVTGGGSGLGAATAAMLVENGATVIVADINVETGQKAAEAAGASAHFVECDVTDEASVKRTIDVAMAQDAPLRGAISCAGIVFGRRTVGRKGAHDLASFERVIQINLIGTFNVCRLAAEAISQAEPLDDGERGILINTSSVAAFDGQIGQAAYGASKAAINGMTLPLARDLSRSGIRAVTIAPGLFDTPMMSGLPDDARESLGKQVPFPSRLGHPAEYASTVKYIIETVMINGEVIRLDGAIRMAPK